MKTTTGTSHFESRSAAVDYYRAYEGRDAEYAVSCKLAAGEIHLGPPDIKPGETLSVIPGEGRYAITSG